MKLSLATFALSVKRRKLGHQWSERLTHALRAPVNPDGTHPLGEAFRDMRLAMGILSTKALAQSLGITYTTLNKLEARPHQCGQKPLNLLLEAYGLVITLETPKENRIYGYPNLHTAFVSRRLSNPEMTQGLLKHRSGIGRTTIQDFESGKPIKLGSMLSLIDAIGAQPIILTPDRLATPDDMDRSDSDQPPVAQEPMPKGVDRYAPTLAELLEPGRKREALKRKLNSIK